ncbi:MAG: diaminopimelate decarboxylase [Pseudomonadales bacterium]
MTTFTRRNGMLHADEVALPDIASAVGTPCYVYSRRHFEAQYQRLRAALNGLDAEICYAVKANSNLAVLRVFAALGAGFDIVSGGELQRVISAGGDPARVVFSGVGKSAEEIDFALKMGIARFNVESAPELERIAARAQLLSRRAAIAIRVNPDVDARTHPYISTGLKSNKFGVPLDQAQALYRRAADSQWLEVHGVACHIGSQITSPAPLLQAFDSLLTLCDDLAAQGIELQHIDMGGGLGVHYHDEPEFDADAYGRSLATRLDGRRLRLALEPGRFLVANGGALLTRIEYLKPAAAAGGHSFAVVDAGMNDLIRPALYQAWHDVQPVAPPAPDAHSGRWQIVGPVCESADFLAHDRELSIAPGDLLAVLGAGAYGMAQSSNYNSRSRPAEVLVEGSRFHVIRRRETILDQLRLELEEA